jgi:hypothetical protein
MWPRGGPRPEVTGAFVLYADQGSFTLMTPQGHMFAGWTTFSAERAGEATIVRVQTLTAPLHRRSRPAA